MHSRSSHRVGFSVVLALMGAGTLLIAAFALAAY
jgi:hypothetical protein